MNIYQFQNYIYIWYQITSVFIRHRRALYFQMPISSNNVLRRVIGEEISNFLKDNKDIIVF